MIEKSGRVAVVSHCETHLTEPERMGVLLLKETLIYLRCLRQGPSPSERFDEAADTVGV